VSADVNPATSRSAFGSSEVQGLPAPVVRWISSPGLGAHARGQIPRAFARPTKVRAVASLGVSALRCTMCLVFHDRSWLSRASIVTARRKAMSSLTSSNAEGSKP
jgi:hypothetical protein